MGCEGADISGILQVNNEGFIQRKNVQTKYDIPVRKAHKGNHICLYDFSFSLHCECLVGERLYMPINAVNCTTKSAIYVVELSVMG